ncbi:hypothetical protein HDV00_010234 [Rhizophlyctis rosea]|nr:hypothetical protein HDV00_010234 [Rhizophlyctis rosea]
MGICHSSEDTRAREPNLGGPSSTTVKTEKVKIPEAFSSSKPHPQFTEVPRSVVAAQTRPRAESFSFDSSGRRLHADLTPLTESTVTSDRLYFLPNDDEEMDRLHLQHYIIRLIFGSNFSAPVTQMLKESGRKVLDLGCGSGIWSFEVASDFPQCQVTGFDLSPVQPDTVKPKNVQFLEGDLTKVPLPFPDASFDFVDMRFLFSALKADHWPILISEIVRILKPGGYLELMEAPTETFSGPTTVPHLLNIVMGGLKARGIEMDIARKLKQYFEAQGELTDVHEVIRVQSMRPDASDEEGIRIVKMLADDIASGLLALNSVFVKMGICQEAEFKGLVREHLRDMMASGHPTTWIRCYGRKKEAVEE